MDEGSKKKAQREHQARRTGSAVRARSPLMRAHVLVADQVVDEFDFLLSVRRQPQIDEGRQGRDRL